MSTTAKIVLARGDIFDRRSAARHGRQKNQAEEQFFVNARAEEGEGVFQLVAQIFQGRMIDGAYDVT